MRPELTRDFLLRTILILALSGSVFTFSSAFSTSVFAQSTLVQNTVESPTRDKLFRADDKRIKKANKKQVSRIIATDAQDLGRVDFKAPTVNMDRDNKKIIGSDGVLMNGLGTRIEASGATLDTETNNAEMKGGLNLSTSIGSLQADSGSFNFVTEQGEFNNAKLQVEDGGYKLESEKLIKYGDESLETYNTVFTTCDCGEGSYPWSFFTKECDVTKEGYAHAYDVTFRILDVPVFYTPYLGFPAKVDRASGLLAPTVGYSNRTGTMYRQPVLGIIDNSNDITTTPFIETKAREGFFLDYGGAYTPESSIQLRALYSDESLRNPLSREETIAASHRVFGKNDLHTIIGGGDGSPALNDPFFDEDRFGVTMNQKWTQSVGRDASVGVYSNINYLSDDLILREIQDSQLGNRQDQYAYSKVAARTTIGDLVSAEVTADYTQLLIGDDDLQFQHLPEATVDVGQTFRPLGQNSYGFKLVTNAEASYTDFTRKVGYDGSRTTVSPSVTVPLRYENYVSTAFIFSLDQSQYNLRDKTKPITDTANAEFGTDQYTDSSSTRTLPRLGIYTSNALERVFPIERDSWLVSATSIGSESQVERLARVKNSVEPFVSYSYIPKVNQDDNPLFDEFDHLGERSLVTYGVKSSYMGRFLPTLDSASDMPELDEAAENMPMIGIDSTTGATASPGATVKRGSTRELASFSIYQGYDIDEKSNEGTADDDPLRRPYTDVTLAMDLFPTRYFGIEFGSNIDSYDSEFSSWNVATSLRSDRGDRLMLRTTYQRDPTTDMTSLSQVEGSTEIKIVDPFSIGYYTRYDEKNREFFENRVALRFKPGCDCWYFDLGYQETVNPDKETFLLSFTLLGLGDISQDVLSYRDRQTTTQ